MDARRQIRPALFGLRPIGILFYLLIVAGVGGIAYVSANFGFKAGLIVSILPAGLCALLYTVKSPVFALFGLFVVNYFVMSLARYFQGVPMGTLLDAMILYNLLVLLLSAITHRIEWFRARTWLTLMAFIWLLYGVLELLNPQTVSVQGWFSSVRSISFHFFFIVVLTQIIMDDYRYLRYLLYVWSVLTLLAVARALVQKYIGFSNAEFYWLYVSGGQTTHIIYSGVRYFSFFSDAANFGAAMGLAMVVFSTTALCFDNKLLKMYLLFVAAAACYGMLISGTRSAIVVPFVGYFFYILMSKNSRVIVLGTLAVVMAFVFLNYTRIGEGNAIIRRARSVFDTSDPSFVVRLENQKKLRELMWDKPFGAGIGHGGGKAKEFAPDAPISQIPTDSWLVLIWVETGIVGILLHLTILLSVIGRGMFLVMRRLRHPQLRGIIASLTAGIAGVVTMSYANEILGQIPMGVIVYMSMAFIFLSPIFDEQLIRAEAEKSKCV